MKTFILTCQDRRNGELSKRAIVADSSFDAHQVAKQHWGETHNVKAIYVY